MRLDLPWLSGDSLPRCYSALFFNENGQALRSISLMAVCDGEAIQKARSLSSEIAIDLWEGLRFIEHFAPRAPASG